MKKIVLKSTDQTPNVILDKENGVFEFSGNALPEDINDYYKPLFRWWDEYIEEPNENTRLIFKLVYFNSASSKMIFEIMKKLEKLYEKGFGVEILWYYSEDDEDMEISGEEFAAHFDYPFEIVKY